MFKYFKWYDLTIVMLVAGMSLLAMMVLAGRVLGDYNIDTTPISNIGFAVLAGLASLCFSWAKAFDTNDLKQKKIVKDLHRAGSRAIFSSICFISASLCKYVFREFDKFKDDIPVYEGFAQFMFGLGYLIPFFAAAILVYLVIGRMSIVYLQSFRIFKDD